MTQSAKTIFDEAWAAVLSSNKSEEEASINIERYNFLVRGLKKLKVKYANGGTKTPIDCWFLQKYNIVIMESREWLVKPSSRKNASKFLKYVIVEDLFDVLHEAHQSIDHGTFDEMLVLLSNRYCNVSSEAVKTYMKLCQYCTNRDAMIQETLKIGLEQQELQPILPSLPSDVSDSYFSAHFEFINMHQNTCDGYAYIMVHWYLSNLFINLVPLHNIEPKNVAAGLLDIYSTFGIPNFINAPFDVTYIYSVIKHINSVWQGEKSMVFRNSNDVENIHYDTSIMQHIIELCVNDADFQINWPLKLKYLQFKMNNQIKPGKLLAEFLYLY